MERDAANDTRHDVRSSTPDDLSAHRTRSNRRPEPKLHPPEALVIAVDEVYEALEDKG